MAKLRSFKCYRTLDRPYTRRSKYKAHNFISTTPASKITKFNMGSKNINEFEYQVKAKSKLNVQIRHNAIESARLVSNRILQRKLGVKGYSFSVDIYPHHILRENKILTGGHADRLQTGMAHSFGKPISVAAQVKKGKSLFTAYVNENDIEVAKEALKAAFPRLPTQCSIEISENLKKK